MSTRRNRRAYLGPRHPLAEVARRRCDDMHGFPRTALLGKVACGECWEHVIRTDERVVVEHDLGPIDPMEANEYVDEVAVERACRGERLKLTPAERAEVVRRLATQNLTPGQIAYRMRTSTEGIRVICTNLTRTRSLLEVA